MDILSRTPLRADHRIPYATGTAQFGDLWYPTATSGTRLPPLVVFLHGGWWKAAYSLEHASFLCAALRRAGVAVFSLEYRRVGDGGGWPNTFLDAARGFDTVAVLAKTYPMDLTRVVVMGHSAGAHLAFWLAGRQHILAGSGIQTPVSGVPIRQLISLAGAVDLGLTLDLAHGAFAHDRREIEALMGGAPDEVPERYLAGDPGHLLPLGVPQHLVQGTVDDQIPAELPRRWAEKAQRQGDHVSISMLPGAEHMDLVDPESKAWGAVLEAVKQSVSF